MFRGKSSKREKRIDELLSNAAPVRVKEKVVHALLDALQPGQRRRSVEHFVNYYFAHEKKRDEESLTQSDLEYLYEKCKAAMTQTRVFHATRTKKIHSARYLQEETVIDGGERVHGDHKGTKGWVAGWLTTYPTDAYVELKLDAPIFVTRMMVHAVNVKASPRSMELHGKDENGEWVLVRGFHFRDRDYEGSHGSYEYNKCEMFYVLGHASNQKEIEGESWEAHPLAGPGRTTSGAADKYLCSDHWKWSVIDSNGAGYVGINDFSLYGREAVLPAPTNVRAKSQKTGALIKWDPLGEDVTVDHFHIIAHPGGFGHHASGGFYEKCDGTEQQCYFPNLSPGRTYQFQVIAVDEDGNDGIPSSATEKIKVREWKPDAKTLGITDEVMDKGTSSENKQHEVYEPLDGYEYESLEIPDEIVDFSDEHAAFDEMIKGNFNAVKHLTSSNTVTLYVSGNLEDTDVERKYISQYAIPRLELWCHANDYDFSGIDLRWGLASEVAEDHKTYAIHMQELEKSFKNSALVIFYFISGQRYGSVLLPDVISKMDRDAILEGLKDELKWIIDVAYVLDENGDPPVYKLQNISKIESSSEHTFWDSEGKRGVHSLLKEIMNVMMKSTNISANLKEWQPSLAIAECSYALKSIQNNSRHKFLCGRRTLDNLYRAMESERDLPIEKQKAREMGCVDMVERREIYDLRIQLTQAPAVSIYEYSFDWKTDGIDISREDASMKRLCSSLYSEVKHLITHEFKNRKVLDQDEQEMLHHATFVKKRTESFFGREPLLSKVMANIADRTGKITVIHGVSGAGKTSVMCVTAAKAKVYLPEEAIVIVRLCGTSPRSSSAKGIIKSVCLQINRCTGNTVQGDDIPDLFDELVEYFHELLEDASDSVPIAIFIDSLDQLSDEDAGRSQPWKWIPKQVPENVYIVVSSLPDLEYGILQALSEAHPRQVQVPLVPSVESSAILKEWMKLNQRTLTDEQDQIVTKCLTDAVDGISILHLRLICDRAIQWPSQHIPPSLPLTVQGMIERTYEELEKEHGEKLVEGLLSLSGASKDGLSSENVADILSADEDALGGKGKAGTILERHDPPVRRVPPFLVARLKNDLREYLIERGANGVTVLGLYHRQFIEVSNRRYLQSEQSKEKAYRQLMEYFNGESANKFIERGIPTQPFWFFIDGDDRVPNKQKLVELPYALLGLGDYEEHANLITDFDYIESKCTAAGDYATSLIEDYITSIQNLGACSKEKEVRSFFRFISTWFHVLRINPSCLTSLAMNYVPENIVTMNMNAKWDQKLGCEEGGWIKWNNAPKAIDPCVFTNVVARADCIIAVKCSPDGKRCVVAGKRFCGVYDLRAYRLQCDFRGHTTWIRSVCFSPDGRYVLSVSNDNTGRVWNSYTAEQCSVLSGHLSWVFDCDWSPKDHVVLTASEDGTARLWNPYLGDLIGLYEEHGASVKCGTFSPTGDEAVTGDVEGKIMKWSVPSCKVVNSIDVKEIVNCLQWSGQADMIAAATFAGDVLLLNNNLETIRILEGFSFSVNRCVFSPEGTELMAAGAEMVGHVYDLTDGSILGRLVGHSKQITCVDWSSTQQGSFLLTGSEDQTIKQWERSDIIPGDVFETFADESWKPTGAFAIAFTREGDLCGLDGSMHLFRCADVLGNARTAPFLVHYGDGPQVGDKTCGALSPDGRTWAVCSYGHSSQTISSGDGHKRRDFSLDVCHNTLVWDPSGAPRFFASGHGNNAVVWNSETGEREVTFDIDTWVWDASWSTNGRFIVVSHDENTVVFDMHADLMTEERLKPVFEERHSMRCALNSDGSRLGIIAKTDHYYDSKASTGHMFDLTNLAKVDEPFDLEGRFEHAERLIFTSDDRFLLVSFSSTAFGSSPSICAYDAEFSTPMAWFVSPINNNFVRLAVPYNRCSEFVAVDKGGKIFIFNIEEA